MEISEVAPGAVEGNDAPEQTPAHRASAPDATRRQRLRLEVAMVMAVVWLPWFAAGILNLVEPISTWSLRSVVWDSARGVGLLALLFYFAWLDGDWRRRLGLERPRVLGEILVGVGVWVAMVVANDLVYSIPVGLEDPYATPLDFEPAALWFVPVDFLIFALLEEVFYRAYLWNRLTELTRRPRLSIAISALLFSAAHVYPLQASAAIFFYGMLLGWIFAVRRSLWGLVLGHWIFNLVVTYGTYGN